jgi:three-Cys-motif partner protein
LIQEYLRLFLYITKHGTYIDGFAGPQDPSRLETWAAKLVLELKPDWLRDFLLCELSDAGVRELGKLQATHASRKRRVQVFAGDFNVRVADVLASGRIKERTATFALLDQRTFECDWKTVEALSRHKSKNKIELFYFLASGWIDRSIAAVRVEETKQRVERWWGRPDWSSLRGIDGTTRAHMVAKRFETELGYKKATPFAIHSDKRSSRVMYHMIHATDHDEAPVLMVRAYRKTSGRSELSDQESQLDIEKLLAELQRDEP